MVRNSLLNGVEVQKRHKLGDGLCPLCGTIEETNHILFSCIMAQFLWGCIRDVIGCSWALASFAEFHMHISRLSGISRRLC